MPIIRWTLKIDDVPTDPTSIVLSDPTGTYGVKRNDTDAVVVADGTAMTKIATGVYEHTFTAPAAGLTYTYYNEWVYGGETHHHEGSLSDVAADGYCTLAELKDDLGIAGSGENDALNRIINDVKKFIDNYCKRRFDTTTETRYFDGAVTLNVDDLVSVTTLKLDEGGDGVYEKTLATTDYKLYPLNAYPKTQIKINPNGNYSTFADGVMAGVEIAGTWGYAATVPDDIRRASLMWSGIIHRVRKAAYSNTLGSENIGVVTIDRDPPAQVRTILDSGYRRVVLA
jgi:hypothetical protein